MWVGAEMHPPVWGLSGEGRGETGAVTTHQLQFQAAGLSAITNSINILNEDVTQHKAKMDTEDPRIFLPEYF